MIVITYQRDKCIGCNYCVELDVEHWRLSKRDGKSNLLGSQEKKGFHTLKITSGELDFHEKVSKSCPAGIIKVKEV